MPKKLHLFFRVILIYVITILSGTLIAATLIQITNSGGINWVGFFLMGLLFTGGASLPNIPILFLGHYFIYNKIKTRRNRTLALVGMGLLICCIPVVLFTVVWFAPSSADELLMDKESLFLIGLSIPYAIIALLSIVGLNLFFDKRKGIVDTYEEDEDILDDMI